MNFKSPDAKHIVQALGDISQLPTDLKLFVTKNLRESFRPLPIPSRDDWLSSNHERGQTMKSYERTISKATPHATYNTIFIQPIGTFNQERSIPLNVIAQFVRVFYAGCEVKVLPSVDLPNDIVCYENNGIKQYRTDGFLNYLSRTRNKRDHRRELLCIGVTMVDIFVNESSNFVYGLAESIDGIAIYSFARLDPLFPVSLQTQPSFPLSKEHRFLMLRRCIKVLLHELGHLFGLRHCIYYICLMNGANNDMELDRQPLYLCPVCLRKLYSTLHFDVRDMYEKFIGVCETHELEEDKEWYQKRLACLQDNVE